MCLTLGTRSDSSKLMGTKWTHGCRYPWSISLVESIWSSITAPDSHIQGRHSTRHSCTCGQHFNQSPRREHSTHIYHKLDLERLFFETLVRHLHRQSEQRLRHVDRSTPHRLNHSIEFLLLLVAPLVPPNILVKLEETDTEQLWILLAETHQPHSGGPLYRSERGVVGHRQRAPPISNRLPVPPTGQRNPIGVVTEPVAPVGIQLVWVRHGDAPVAF